MLLVINQSGNQRLCYWLAGLGALVLFAAYTEDLEHFAKDPSVLLWC